MTTITFPRSWCFNSCVDWIRERNLTVWRVTYLEDGAAVNWEPDAYWNRWEFCVC